jgi:hypothetical protein
MKHRLLLTMTIASVLVAAGCGSSDGACDVIGLNIAPTTASVDHLAAAPANTQQFIATSKVGPSCPAVTAAIRRDVMWSVSNAAATISNVNDTTYGVATCVATSANAITVTATLPADKNNGMQVSGTASLTCR